MFDITSFAGRHRWGATFLEIVENTSTASLPHPPNTSTTKGTHDHSLRALASSFLECFTSSPSQHDHKFELLDLCKN